MTESATGPNAPHQAEARTMAGDDTVRAPLSAVVHVEFLGEDSTPKTTEATTAPDAIGQSDTAMHQATEQDPAAGRRAEIQHQLQGIEAKLNEYEPISIGTGCIAKGDKQPSSASLVDMERSAFVRQKGDDAALQLVSTVTGEGVVAVFDGIGSEPTGKESSGQVAFAVEEYFASAPMPRTVEQAEQQVKDALMHAGTILPVDRRKSTALVARLWRDASGVLQASIGGVGDSNAYRPEIEGSINDPNDMVALEITSRDIVASLTDNGIAVNEQNPAQAQQIRRATQILRNTVREATTLEDAMERFADAKQKYGTFMNLVPDDVVSEAYYDYDSSRNVAMFTMENVTDPEFAGVSVVTVALNPGERLAVTTDGVDPLRSEGVNAVLEGAESAAAAATQLVVDARNYEGIGQNIDDTYAIVIEVTDEENQDFRKLLVDKQALIDEAALLQDSPAPQSEATPTAIDAGQVTEHFADIVDGKPVEALDGASNAHIHEQMAAIELEFRANKLEVGMVAVSNRLHSSLAKLVGDGDILPQIRANAESLAVALADYDTRLRGLNGTRTVGELAAGLTSATNLVADEQGALAVRGPEGFVELYTNIVAELQTIQAQVAAEREKSQAPLTPSDKEELTDMFTAGGSTLDGLRGQVAALYPKRQDAVTQARRVEELVGMLDGLKNVNSQWQQQLVRLKTHIRFAYEAQHSQDFQSVAGLVANLSRFSRETGESAQTISRIALLCQDIAHPTQS